MPDDQQRLERIETKLDALSDQVGSGNRATAVMAARAEACERRFCALEKTVYGQNGLHDTVTRLATRGSDFQQWTWLLVTAALSLASAAGAGMIVAAAAGG